MKYQKILGLVATAGLLLAGCATDSDNSNTWLSDPNAVHVSASVGSIFTRSNPAASDEAGQKSFNTGDVMGVSNNGTSITYTYNKDTNDWQPGNGSYLVWDASNLTFQCWYPADGKNSYSKGYIQEDQSNGTEIAKSDYMKAEVTTLTKIPDSRQLDVTLVRKTARLILNIQSFNDQFTTDTKVNHIRIASKASTDASETSTVNIKPLQNGEGGKGTTYTALVIPGEVEGKLYFTTEESTETPLVVKTGTLVAGKSYTYNLIVGKNKVTIGDVTVADWGKGETLNGTTDVKDKTPYVTFSAPAEQTFKMVCYGDYEISKLEYSVNFGDWKAVEDGEGVTFGGKNGGLRLRGKNVNGTASFTSNFSKITFTDADVKVACTGDIRTLLDWENYRTVDTKDARFCFLFDDCSVLTSAPKLPATTLAESCYEAMFQDCTSLTSAPELPAKTLANYCYSTMFDGCTSLTSAPELKATTLAYYCYYCMFYGCTSLTSAPELPAIELEERCYQGMFDGCTSLKTAPDLPATKLVSHCYKSMFRGCKKLTSAPKLPAKTLAYYCYSTMFSGCTSLTSAPELPAIELEERCYQGMFDGCTSLTSTPELKATTLAEGCYYTMFKNCTKLSSVTMLAPSTAIESTDNCVAGWLQNAGKTTSRTLKLQDKNAYEALKANTDYLPTIWQIGSNCTVLDNAGNAITE